MYDTSNSFHKLELHLYLAIYELWHSRVKILERDKVAKVENSYGYTVLCSFFRVTQSRD